MVKISHAGHALAAHRRRLKRRGMVRLEVRVRKEDAGLVRTVVRALDDPDRRPETRKKLRQAVGVAGEVDIKALLASAPLEGIDLARDRDLARDIEW
jgi:hypothetical protein